MKAMTKRQAALAALLLAVGCGSGGSLPTEPEPGPGGVVAPPPDDTPPITPVAQSLWPLTTGSTWSYDIDDPQRGRFTKTVTVKGPAEVPGQPGVQAIQVESVKPHITELSWQQEADGLVKRLREEDRLPGGNLARTAVWSPATLKSLSALRELNWTYTQPGVIERVAYFDGSVTEEPEKPYEWRVVAVDESVNVPAGTFKALRVERDRTDKTSKRIYWLVPGIGKVKEDSPDGLEELRSYSVKP
jgi:hypothetical protein